MRRGLLDLILQLWKRVSRDDIFGLAAQMAYYFLLSLFPLLLFLVSLLPYLPITEADLLAVVRDFAPAGTVELIESNIQELTTKNIEILSFGIIATMWSASNGINAIVRAFNKAYDVKESRPYLIARGMSILFTFAMLFVIIIALLLPVFGKLIGIHLFSKLGLSDDFLATWNTLRWLISSIILFIVFTGLYWIAPNKKLSCLSIIPGALFATIGWELSSLAFSFYVTNIANYSATYGSIGAIIVLLIWIYITGIVIIIGGEINALHSKIKEKPC